ncbi:MAG: hypothetical protein HY901_06265 [Deltaproteobacteria bacterium]|nr:hypothetical protein [Deltaproteobacteria bacterium]
MRLRVLFAIVLGAALCGCPDAADQFIEGRLLDPCNSSWPVCTTTAGCFVGNSYYLEGQFPGTRRFIVRTDGQAAITLSVFLKTQGAVGHELRMEWNDAACGSKFVELIDGTAFFKEVEAEGSLSRTKNVYRAGDHLLEVSSDSTAEYLLKAEVKAPEDD